MFVTKLKWVWKFAIIGAVLFASNWITVSAEETTISYCYETDEYGRDKAVGFIYDGKNYKYQYDERDIITYILDANDDFVCHYECDDYGTVTAVYEFTDMGWKVNSCNTFIGNINKIRWLGFEWFDESDSYLIGDRFYNILSRTYNDGVDNSSYFVEQNPFVSNDDGIMVADAYYNDMEAQEWADTLLADSSYGIPYSYSSNWYGTMSTVELLARCIYCEGGTEYTTEGNTVARVILNRVNHSDFPSDPRSVITAGGQFAAVTGGSATSENAREPATTTARWRNATYLACLMLTTTDANEWDILVGNSLKGQLHFYSYTIAKNKGDVFSGTSSESLYYGTKHIKDVYVLGYGTVTSFTTLFNNYNPKAYSRNIYYNFY